MPTVLTSNRPSSDIHRVRAALKALHDIAADRVDLTDGPAWDAIEEAHSAWLWSTPDDEQPATPAPAAAQSPAAGVDLREAARAVVNYARPATDVPHHSTSVPHDLLSALKIALDAPSSDRGGATDGWSFDMEAAKQAGIKVDLWFSEDEGPGYRRTDLHWGYPQHTCGEMGRLCDSCPPDEAGWLNELEQFAFEEGEAQGVIAWRIAPANPAPSTTTGAAL